METQYFDFKAFEKTDFIERTAIVKVSDENGQQFGITIRNLTANEIAKSLEAMDAVKVSAKIANALSDAEEIAIAVKNILAIDESTRPDLARRLSIFVSGVVSEHKISAATAAKFAKFKAGAFYIITQKIMELTEQGADTKKKR